MADLKRLQDQIWANKVAKGFNTTNVDMEFNCTYGELAEAYDAYLKKKPNVGEELADVMIYTLALARMLNVDIEQELMAKIKKNKAREYRKINGVLRKVEE